MICYKLGSHIPVAELSPLTDPYPDGSLNGNNLTYTSFHPTSLDHICGVTIPNKTLQKHAQVINRKLAHAMVQKPTEL